MRDVRGPGQGRSVNNARELVSLTQDLGLHDAWILKKGGTFVPTWKRGSSETRLDRFYVSEALSPVVADVVVRPFPAEAGRVSDHFPVILSMALPDRRLDGARPWRLDLAVLADDAAKEILRAGVSGTFSGARDPSQEWDTLKVQWQHWAKECGRNVRLRLMHELNETLRKIRIVKAGAPLTPTTREFLGVLRARYDRIFLQTTQKVHIYPQDSMFRDTPELTRFLKSRRSLNGPNEYAMSVCMRDGSVSEDGTDIDRCFLEYFSHLFAESDQVTDSSAVIRELESLCAGVPKLPEEASANLTKKASAAEVFSILRSLKVGSAPGPDGLPTEFYKELWPEIGAGLVAMINGILNSGKVPESLAEGKLILLPKEAVLQALDRAVFSFFWDRNTERLQRDALRLPRSLGGYALPCIGPLRRVLVPRALGNLCPSAERTPPHYKALVTLFRELTAMDPDLDPRDVAPARLCEQLVSARGTLRSPPPTFPWLELTSGKVPKEVADLQWQRGWRILPTLERLQRWGMVQSARCPNCGNTETAAHAVSTCVVARTFWLLIHRTMPSLRVAHYYTRDRCPRGRFGRLVIAAGEYVLWRNRCRAVVRRQRLRLQWPLLSQFRETLICFLESQLTIHGEAEFLRHWSCPFLGVAGDKVKLSVRFPDLEVY
ncbi:hypothetical protein MTO96_024350 [Rhipicephalus appendiculatus]